MMQKWLAVVGIGEDGVLGLSPIAHSLVDSAEVLVGGDRHLSMLPEDGRDRIPWTSPIDDSVDEILRRRGQLVCVLASGDPMCYGIGVTLTRRISVAEMTIVPALSTFSLICARLGWSLAAVETLSLCSRPVDLLQSYLYPGAKLLILSEGKHTPMQVATTLVKRGFGGTSMTVLERLGGPQERIVSGMAATWTQTDLADLNAIALDCLADADTIPLSRTPGLPDDAYHHDGQLTKREVRAVTLSALAPLPGELLWDVGAGCGSIGIEWMRSHPRCRAIAIEKSRSHYIADNAAALGMPYLRLIDGIAPAALQDLPSPDAIFIGGGATAPDLFETCWPALKSGGRIVANVVTLEGEQKLFEWQRQVGGTLTRIEIQRAAAIGSFLGWKPMAPVTQWGATKS
jgi:precorrin-6B C5,15-methyltransferase / cobalt-precorrin-6B C5,C15-methyltransferase